MIVYILVNVIDGYIYGVYTSEKEAYRKGNTLRGCRWEVYEREVQA